MTTPICRFGIPNRRSRREEALTLFDPMQRSPTRGATRSTSWFVRLVQGMAIWFATAVSVLCADIQRIWLTHRSPEPSRIVVNWESAKPGNSVVNYGPTSERTERTVVPGSDTLHHVEISIPRQDTIYYYRVESGPERSAVHSFKSCPSKELRVAVVANWHGRPSLDAIRKDDVHILMTAGDNIPDLHRSCGPGMPDCIEPYLRLVASYPEVFRSTPFLPVLGNHDREMRPRGTKPPAEPVYDIEAAAFRRFFELPGDEWKWHFDAPAFNVRFAALDLNHLSDFGTTLQTCHAFQQGSTQFEWYSGLMARSPQAFFVTLYNEQNSRVRRIETGAWGWLIRQGSIAISGFGHFAERADIDGFSCYNTSFNGKGDRYPDPQSAFLRGEHGYVLLTFRNEPADMIVELKTLDGEVMDRKRFARRSR